MPVYKYRSVEDMPSERWLKLGDPAIGDRLRFVSRMAIAATAPLGVPRGVHKFRSIEEMDAARDRWEQERVDRIRAERAR